VRWRDGRCLREDRRDDFDDEDGVISVTVVVVSAADTAAAAAAADDGDIVGSDGIFEVDVLLLSFAVEDVLLVQLLEVASNSSSLSLGLSFVVLLPAASSASVV